MGNQQQHDEQQQADESQVVEVSASFNVTTNTDDK